MRRTLLAGIVFVTLSAGCATTPKVLPDPSIPHRVAKDGKVTIYVRQPDGRLKKEEVKLQEGWWIASPQIVEP